MFSPFTFSVRGTSFIRTKEQQRVEKDLLVQDCTGSPHQSPPSHSKSYSLPLVSIQCFLSLILSFSPHPLLPLICLGHPVGLHLRGHLMSAGINSPVSRVDLQCLT